MGFFFYFLIIFIILLTVANKSFFVVDVKGQSMLPTLSHGETIIVFRYWPRWWYKRGDIVILTPPYHIPIDPKDVTLNSLLVKRIIGLAGDNIELTNKGATINIVDIPPGHCFVCGDNRDESTDSRDWGPLKLSSIRGLMVYKF